MKRFLLITLSAMIMSVSASAQITGLMGRSGESLSDRGYRGYVEVGGGVGQSNGSNYMYRQWIVDASTTHGYQINRHWFAGAGVDFLWINQDNEYCIPVYAAARFRLPDVGCHPYAEGRVGIIAANSVWQEDVQRLYLAGSLGIEIIPRLRLAGRLTYFQTPFGDMSFYATLGLAFAFGR